MNNPVFLRRWRFERLNLLALMWILIVACILASSASGAAISAASSGVANAIGPGTGYGPITTFSIVAYDPETGDYGVGVQSKYFAVGDVVPFAAAGQAAGGDARGRQSAAVLVVRKNAGYLGLTDRHIDLHVEDHPTPIRELKRLLDIRHAQLAAVKSQDLLEKAKQVSPEVQARLVKQAREAAENGVGFFRGDDHLWWLVAQTRWLDGDLEAAVDAGQVALLLSPSWPRLPEATRVELGLRPELVDALRQDQAFRRLWDSLAVTGSAQ